MASESIASACWAGLTLLDSSTRKVTHTLSLRRTIRAPATASTRAAMARQRNVVLVSSRQRLE